MYDVCALGELLIDFTPSGVDERGMVLFGRNPGGAPENVLAMNAKLGGKTVFIGKVGDDEFGRFLVKALGDAGVDTWMLDPAYLTTLAFVHLSETGDRSFSFYRREGADLMLSWKEIDQRIINDANIFHFGSVSLCGEPCRTAVHKAARYARAQGKIISYDPNYRPFLWPDRDEAKNEIERLLPDADLLKVSEEEMTLLTGEENVEKGGALLTERSGAVVLVSLGAKGSYFHCADGNGSLPAYDTPSTRPVRAMLFWAPSITVSVTKAVGRCKPFPVTSLPILSILPTLPAASPPPVKARFPPFPAGKI
jgi:fructokinase